MNNLIKYENKFDAIICDPPYGIWAKIKQNKEKNEKESSLSDE